MKVILAHIFRQLFKMSFFRERYFGIYEKIFKPYRVFNGVVQKVSYEKFKLKLHIDDWVQQHIFFLGGYEAAELKAAEHFIKADSVFIDIGANVGLYAVHLSKTITTAGKIICFEPFSTNFNALRENIALNNLSQIQIEKLAVGAQQETLKLYCNPVLQNSGMISATPMENGYTEVVDAVSLDFFFKEHPLNKIDLIKIDIEGYEYNALCGMQQTLTVFQPTLLIEIFNDGPTDTNSLQCENFLKALDYKKYFIGDDGSLSATQVNKSRTNYIFTTTNPSA